MKAKRVRKEIKRCSICGAQLFSDIEKEFNLCPRHLHLASDNDTEPAKKVKATKPKKAKASKRSSTSKTKKAKEEIK